MSKQYFTITQKNKNQIMRNILNVKENLVQLFMVIYRVLVALVIH